MNIVCDTDVLSEFAKIDGLNLLSELFPKHKIVISNGVYEELIFIKQVLAVELYREVLMGKLAE